MTDALDKLIVPREALLSNPGRENFLETVGYALSKYLKEELRLERAVKVEVTFDDSSDAKIDVTLPPEPRVVLDPESAHALVHRVVDHVKEKLGYLIYWKQWKERQEKELYEAMQRDVTLLNPGDFGELMRKMRGDG